MNKYNSNNQQGESVAEETMCSSMFPAEIIESINEFIRTKDDASQWIPWKQSRLVCTRSILGLSNNLPRNIKQRHKNINDYDADFISRKIGIAT